MDQIILRRAKESDLEEIWELVRVEQELWDDQKIRANLHNLYVIISMRTMVCVLYGEFEQGTGCIHWIAVHPMYPQETVRLAAICGFWGIVLRKPMDQPKKILAGAGNEFPCKQIVGISDLPAAQGTNPVFSFKRESPAGIQDAHT